MVRRFFSFRGRANRKQYWIGVAITFAFAIVAMLVMNILAVAMEIPLYAWGSGDLRRAYLGALACLLIVAVGVPVTARRLHDVNRSLAWLLVPIAMVCVSAFIVEAIYLRFTDRGADETVVASLAITPVITLIHGLIPVSVFGLIDNWPKIAVGGARAVAKIIDNGTTAVVGLWWLYTVGLQRGTAGPNHYGADPADFSR